MPGGDSGDDHEGTTQLLADRASVGADGDQRSGTSELVGLSALWPAGNDTIATGRPPWVAVLETLSERFMQVTSTRQQPDGSALHAVESDDGQRWVIRSVPWYSRAGDYIGTQWFLCQRDSIHATIEGAETAALELACGGYRPSKILGST